MDDPPGVLMTGIPILPVSGDGVVTVTSFNCWYFNLWNAELYYWPWP